MSGKGLIGFDLNADGMLRVASRLTILPNGYEKVMVRTVNKTAAGVRTDGSRLVREAYAIRSADALGLTYIRKAYAGHLEAVVEIRSNANLSLSRFNPRRRMVRGKDGVRRQAVSVLVKKSSGRRVVRGAFQPDPSGPIFAREGAERLPIVKLFTAAPVRLLGQPETSARLIGMANARLEKNFAHESDYLLQQAGLK